MTSDAKIGLLLGLVFIFVIAFVINGLPSFREATNGSELTMNMVSSQRDSWGIGTNERKVQEGFDWTGQPIEEPAAEEVPPPAEEETEDIRFEMPIPDDIAIVEETSLDITPELIEQTLALPVEDIVQGPEVAETMAAEIAEPVETITIELQPAPKRAKPAMPKIYTVSDGDNLGSIAKKFYGPEEGNRWVNIRKLYEANQKTLKSIDEVVVGQTILIPSLKTSEPAAKKSEGILSASLFEDVKSIGRSLFSGNKPKPKPQAKPRPAYVVQDGDYLWRVAARQLGDATRYKEIIKLNPGVLKDENTKLDIGMRLNLPAR